MLECDIVTVVCSFQPYEVTWLGHTWTGMGTGKA